MRMITLFIIVVGAVYFTGCSSSNSVLPDFSSTTNLDDETSESTGESVLMAKRVVIDLENLTYVEYPLTSRGLAATGDFFGDLEITSFLAAPFCADNKCLYISGIALDPDTQNTLDTTADLMLQVTACHPFAKFNVAEPVSGTNRADLDLFDIRTYIVHDGDSDGLPNPPESGMPMMMAIGGQIMTMNMQFLQSPDGCDDGADGVGIDASDGLDPLELEEIQTYNLQPGGMPMMSTIQPYLRYFDGPTDPAGFIPGSDPVAGDNRMSHGECDVDTFQLNVGPGEGTVEFIIAVTGAFGQAAEGRENRRPENVQYTLPDFRADGYMIIGNPPGGAWPPSDIWPTTIPPADFDIDVVLSQASMDEMNPPTLSPMPRVLTIYRNIDPLVMMSEFEIEATHTGLVWDAVNNVHLVRFNASSVNWYASAPALMEHYQIMYVVDADGDFNTTSDQTAKPGPIFYYDTAPAITHDVSIVGGAFDPPVVNINVGDTVKWTNNDVLAHTSTSGVSPTPDGTWDSGTLMNGQFFEFTFNSVLTYDYFCTFHPLTMSGQVVVN